MNRLNPITSICFFATLEHQMRNNDNRRYLKYLEKQENKNTIKRTKFQGHYNIGQVFNSVEM